MGGRPRVLVVALAILFVVTAIAFVGVRRGRNGRVDPADVREPQRGGTLRIGLLKPTSLDPGRARTVDELLVADQVHDSLTAWDPKTGEPVASLASKWTISDDQQHWDFTLRDGAAFSDGRPVTAADVKFSLERVARRDSGSSVGDLLESVTGFGALADGSSPSLAGVVAVSEDVVRIDLDTPWAELASALGSPAFAVVPADTTSFEEAIGAGPFSVATRRDDGLTLRPVKGRSVLVSAMQVRWFESRAAAYTAMRAGELEWTHVPAEEVEQAAAQFGRSAMKPLVASLFYGFNLRSPTFADVRFREAIVRAVNREKILADVYKGAAAPMTSLVAEGVPGAADDACGAVCGHDVERAKALVNEVFTATGATVPEVVIDFEDDPTQTAVASRIEADLEAAGIPASLRPHALAEYGSFAVNGSQELFRLGWIAAYPSPDAYLAPLFSSGSPSNLVGLSDPGVDEQLRAARASGDAGRRRELYQQAERSVFAQVALLPIAQFEVQSVAAKQVRGLVVTSTGGFDASRVWLARSS